MQRREIGAGHGRQVGGVVGSAVQSSIEAFLTKLLQSRPHEGARRLAQAILSNLGTLKAPAAQEALLGLVKDLPAVVDSMGGKKLLTKWRFIIGPGGVIYHIGKNGFGSAMAKYSTERRTWNEQERRLRLLSEFPIKDSDVVLDVAPATRGEAKKERKREIQRAKEAKRNAKALKETQLPEGFGEARDALLVTMGDKGIQRNTGYDAIYLDVQNFKALSRMQQIRIRSILSAMKLARVPRPIVTAAYHYMGRRMVSRARYEREKEKLLLSADVDDFGNLKTTTKVFAHGKRAFGQSAKPRRFRSQLNGRNGEYTNGDDVPVADESSSNSSEIQFAPLDYAVTDLLQGLGIEAWQLDDVVVEYQDANMIVASHVDLTDMVLPVLTLERPNERMVEAVIDLLVGRVREGSYSLRVLVNQEPVLEHHGSRPRDTRLASSHGEITEGDDMSVPSCSVGGCSLGCEPGSDMCSAHATFGGREECDVPGCGNTAMSGRTKCLAHHVRLLANPPRCATDGCNIVPATNHRLCRTCWLVKRHNDSVRARVPRDLTQDVAPAPPQVPTPVIDAKPIEPLFPPAKYLTLCDEEGDPFEWVDSDWEDDEKIVSALSERQSLVTPSVNVLRPTLPLGPRGVAYVWLSKDAGGTEVIPDADAPSYFVDLEELRHKALETRGGQLANPPRRDMSAIYRITVRAVLQILRVILIRRTVQRMESLWSVPIVQTSMADLAPGSTSGGASVAYSLSFFQRAVVTAAALLQQLPFFRLFIHFGEAVQPSVERNLKRASASVYSSCFQHLAVMGLMKLWDVVMHRITVPECYVHSYYVDDEEPTSVEDDRLPAARSVKLAGRGMLARCVYERTDNAWRIPFPWMEDAFLKYLQWRGYKPRRMRQEDRLDIRKMRNAYRPAKYDILKTIALSQAKSQTDNTINTPEIVQQSPDREYLYYLARAATTVSSYLPGTLPLNRDGW